MGLNGINQHSHLRMSDVVLDNPFEGSLSGISPGIHEHWFAVDIPSLDGNLCQEFSLWLVAVAFAASDINICYTSCDSHRVNVAGTTRCAFILVFAAP
jgi:hypothetical protein